MKISNLLTTSTLAALLALGVTGCGEKHSEGDGHADHDEKAEHADHAGHDDHEAKPAAGGEHSGEENEVHGAEFKEGKGLILPEETSKTLGVKTVEVSEGKISGKIIVPVQVYRVDNGVATASGAVAKDQASELLPGNSVALRFSEKEEFITGKLTRVDQTSEKSSGLVEVIIELPATAGLATGSFLQATLNTRKEEDVVTVPREALLRTATGHSVYVVNAEHYFRTEVKVGEESDGRVEIKEGLYAGDVVVLQPVMSLWMTELAAVRGGVGCTHGH